MRSNKFLVYGIPSLAQQWHPLVRPVPMTILFIRLTSHGSIVLLLYVGDKAITGNDRTGISKLQHYLNQQLEMKYLWRLSYFLGLNVTLDFSDCYLSRAKCTTNHLSQGLTHNMVPITSIENNVKFDANYGTPFSNPTHYQQLAGSLVYLTATQLDIAYDVHIESVHDHARDLILLQSFEVFRYIKGTFFSWPSLFCSFYLGVANIS